MTPIFPVILCGGSGTRLWPLSRASFPKQFLVLSEGGSKKSLFQEALERVQAIASHDVELATSIVVTNEEHRFLALDQLRELHERQAAILLEPSRRNTAPALTLAALFALQEAKGLDPILVVTPADQTVKDSPAFTQAMNSAVELAKQDVIVILGITPTSPQTGYGYIKVRGDGFLGGSHLVEDFVEKPDLNTAMQYLEEGGYFWNGGMFVLKASVWMAALEAFRPDIVEATQAAWKVHKQDASGGAIFIRPDPLAFNAIPSESIDYAVIEQCVSNKAFPLKMVVLDAGWSDLGAWDSVWQAGKQDPSGNVTSGDVLISQSSNSLVHASNRLVSVIGVKNLIVIETADAVLVADKSSSQDIKHIVSKLTEQGRDENNLHRKVFRPWGWYDNVDQGERFKVKRIQVKPGASLSLQKHHHRAEHWIVVKGVAEIANGDQVITLKENESTYIPKGQTHRLSNLGQVPLEIIEVQSGEYLGEDDIIRIEDIYGRS